GLLVERPVAAEDGGVDGLVYDLLVPVLLLLGPGVAAAGDPTFRGERPARGGGHDLDAVRGRLERECGGQPVHAAVGRGIRHPVDPRVATEETLTIVPAPREIIVGRAALHIHSVGNRERRTSFSICSSEYSWNGRAQ